MKAIGNLIGAPVGDKLLRWWPNSSFITQPALYIVAENEELNDNNTNAMRAYDNAKGCWRFQASSITAYTGRQGSRPSTWRSPGSTNI